MNQPRRQELLRKFAEDTCTPAELRELFGYLRQPGYRTEYAEVLQDLWNRMQADQTLDSERSQGILNNILRGEATAEENPKVVRPQFWLSRVAAVFIGILIVAAVGYLYLREDTVRYQTEYGQLQVITLPDSSRVTLNGNSTLSYRADWSNPTDQTGAGREIWLEGEAFFEVTEIVLTSQQKAKFVVHTAQLDVEVVGTAFNVTNRRRATRVVLNSGKVKLHVPVEEQDSIITMEPGDLVAFSEAAHALEQRVVPPEQYSSWKDRQLVFVDTPLRDVITLLEDTYGFRVVLEDPSIAEKKFNGTVSTEQISLLLKALSSTFNLTIQQEDDLITIQRPQ
jgi:ferric-dicitrate binding protein FerR (iron transport regulator)